MKNKTIIIAIALFTFQALTSCNLEKVQRGLQKEQKTLEERIGASTRTVRFLDINGDTITITGGATCHINKKIIK